MKTEKKTAIYTNFPARDFIASCKAVFGGFICLRAAAVFPSFVFLPVAKTSACPSPEATTVPA
jgi:hypothetical protein